MITSTISALTMIGVASTRHHDGARAVGKRDFSLFTFSYSECAVLSTTFKSHFFSTGNRRYTFLPIVYLQSVSSH